MKQRIDKLLVDLGIAESREKAQALILAGQVLVDGRCIEKAGQQIPIDSPIRLKGVPMKYVGRGGLKLEAALDHFSISPMSRLCLDIGASTGGFTDCLLQRGAVGVIAVDVGTNQLDWKLRRDSRVVSLENTNARYLKFEGLGTQVDLIVVDVSFISLELIVPVLPPFCRPSTEVLLLVKPQFEVGKGEVGKGGVVRDPTLHQRAVEKVTEAGERYGFEIKGSVESPITGAQGNKEFFLWLRPK
ncbi:MAG: TlyA family RNA methyltransferase [Acidobacteriia bacterium]|nr:TlyA family RNA methyltransferase [Terriglobia bacterium]